MATQPEQRAEIVTYAAEHGVKAIYAEKAMAASMSDARAMVEAVERNNVAFNLGTNRRWEIAYDTMKELIDDGSIGELRSIILYNNGHLFNAASHSLDLALRLSGDVPARWVQGNLDEDETLSWTARPSLREDPKGEGIVKLENGVTIYALLSGQAGEFEAVGTRGRLRAIRDGREWDFRVADAADQDPKVADSIVESFPDFPQRSSTLRLIEDIVHSLDTGEPTKGRRSCSVREHGAYLRVHRVAPARWREGGHSAGELGDADGEEQGGSAAIVQAEGGVESRH